MILEKVSDKERESFNDLQKEFRYHHDYGPEYDQWKEKNLLNAREAIKDYEGKESTRKGSTTRGRHLKAVWTSMTA